MDIEAYFTNEAKPAARYAGQLAPDFQAALASRYAGSDPSTCRFSHSIDLPDGRSLHGDLDLRGSENDVLGGVDVTGKRVLEVGPLSGWLTSHLAKTASEVVGLEVAPGSEDIMLPASVYLPESARGELKDETEKLRRSWWYVHRELGGKASVVYGDPHVPPSDLSRVDVSVFVTMLLRLPNPFLALQNAAAITEETIIITEPLTTASEPEDGTKPVALFAPGTDSDSQHWWHHSPAALMRMLALLGFGDISLTIHTPVNLVPALPLFTVVGHRTA